MTTIVSFIPEENHRITATQALAAAGIDGAKINVLTKPGEVWQRLDGHYKVRTVFRSAAIGALLAAVIGVVFGAAAGYFNCGKGACTVSDSLLYVIVIALYAIFGGGLMGALAGLDRFENDVLFYVEGVRKGDPLYIIEVPENAAAEADRILTAEHGLLTHRLENNQPIHQARMY